MLSFYCMDNIKPKRKKKVKALKFDIDMEENARILAEVHEDYDVSDGTAARSPFNEVNDRINEVFAWMSVGYTRHDIIRLASKKWNVGARTVDVYTQRARNMLIEINKVEAEDVIAQLKSQLWSIYRDSREDNNLAEANKALMNLAKINGVGNTNLTIKVDDNRELVELSDEDLAKMMDEGNEDE